MQAYRDQLSRHKHLFGSGALVRGILQPPFDVTIEKG
jgi:hypothetical protein